MTIDILPTLAKLTGAALPENKFDGKDMSPLLLEENGKSPHEALYFWWDRELQAVRSGQWKLHFPHSYRTLKDKPGADGKPGDYVQAKIELSLFDLSQDLGEKSNVAEKHPEVVKRLQALAEEARKELGDSATKQTGRGVRQPGRIE
jgi:arylsulfatase A